MVAYCHLCVCEWAQVAFSTFTHIVLDKSYVPQLFGLFRHIMINQHYSRWFALYLAPYAHPPQSRSTAQV